MTRSPFGPKSAIAAVAGDLFLVTRGTGESLEIEKLDPRAAATAALIATGIDAYLGSTDWRTGGGGGGGGDATIMNGTGAPSGAAGADGDFYINTSAWTIYGPKTSGAWGSATSLIGPAGADGADGAAGAAILSGSGAPAGGTGANGDLYFDTAAKAFWGPKSGGSWGSAIPVKGDQGDEGDPGAPGAAVEMQKTATHIEWRLVGASTWIELVALSTLVGPQGPPGIQGPAGDDGADGSNGAAGADGRTILNGSGAPSNALGSNGDFYLDIGARELYGPKASGTWPAAVELAGTNGTNGTNGKSVLNGAGAPAGGTGVDGDFYINTTTWAIHGPKASGAWPAAVALKPPVEVVTSLPGSPDPATWYVITG